MSVPHEYHVADMFSIAILKLSRPVDLLGYESAFQAN